MLHVNVYEYFSPEQQKMCVITRGHFKTHIQGAEKSFQRKKYRLRLWKELYEIEIMEKTWCLVFYKNPTDLVVGNNKLRIEQFLQKFQTQIWLLN